jgi:hypothetical protein
MDVYLRWLNNAEFNFRSNSISAVMAAGEATENDGVPVGRAAACV